MARQFAGRNQDGMRQHQQALDEAAESLPPLVVVHGECEFLRAEAVGRLREAWLAKFPGGDTAHLRTAGEGRPATLADIASELSGGSLFARDKLVVVRQAERALFPQGGRNADEAPAGGDREKSFLALIAQPPSRIWLVLESSQLPKNRILGKRLAEAAFSIPCPSPTGRDIPGWLAARARRMGKSISPDAVEMLARSHGADLGVLAGELEKLILFAGAAEGIDGGMVATFMTGTIEFDVFGFTNAVEARDMEKAVFFARRIARQGARDQRGKREDGLRASHRILAMLAGTVQGLLRARVALAERRDAADFAAAERLSPWRAGKLLEAAGRFQLRELRLMAREAADQMRRVHDTGGDPLLALETMAVTFTAREGGRGERR